MAQHLVRYQYTRGVVCILLQVSQLEMDRKTILQGCRSGFAACYDLFLGSATSAATAAAAAVDAGDGIEAGPEGGYDIAAIGPLARYEDVGSRSGAWKRLQYAEPVFSKWSCR